MADEQSGQHCGVGASVLRKEDDRHLRGRGQFVADIALRGTQEVVFVRSPHAHAEIRSIAVPPAARGRVFTARDLPRIKPIRVVTQAAGARSPAWPPLATEKVRYVGDAVAACVAPTRAEAQELAEAVAVETDRSRQWWTRSRRAPAARHWCMTTSATICTRNARSRPAT
jgi:carbon-monoxide dehydrogenase large subunit